MKKLLLVSVFFLSGCAELAAMQAQQQAQIENNKRQYCANLGAPEGSPNYYDCRLRVEQMLAAEDAAKRAAYYENLDAQSERNQRFMDMATSGQRNNSTLTKPTRCTSTPNALGGMDTTCH